MAEIIPEEQVRDRKHLISRLAALAIQELGELGETTATDEMFRRLHAKYDRNADNNLSPEELRLMLADADVADFFRRGWWVKTIFENADSNLDAGISADEFVRGIRYKGAFKVPSGSSSSSDSGMIALVAIGGLLLLSGRGRR